MLRDLSKQRKVGPAVPVTAAPAGDLFRPRLAWRSHLPPPGTQLAGPRVWDIKSTLFPMRKDMEPEFLCRAGKGRWAPGIAGKVEMEASVPLEDQLSHRPIVPGPPHPSQSRGPYAREVVWLHCRLVVSPLLQLARSWDMRQLAGRSRDPCVLALGTIHISAQRMGDGKRPGVKPGPWTPS